MFLGVRQTLVVSAIRGIGAHDEEILAGLERLMSCPGRKDEDVACSDFKSPAFVAAEPHLGAAARNAEHFMDARVIVQIVVNAVAPAISPSVALENILDDRSGIEIARKTDGATIDDDRPARVVRDAAVVPERVGIRFRFSDQLIQLRRLWPVPARQVLRGLLYVFLERDCTTRKTRVGLAHGGR